MISQREYFRVNDKKGIVQGVFYIHGKRVWRKLCSIDVAELLPSGRHRSEKQRATFLAGLYAEVERQLDVDGPKKRRVLPIKETFQSWIDLAQGIQSPRTIREHYAFMATLFIESVGNIPVTEVSIHHVDRFIARLKDRSLANSSINVRLASLKTFLRWAQERGYVRDIPKIKMLPTTKQLPKVLDDGQIARLFAHIREKKEATKNPDHARQYLLHERFLMLVGFTGARLAEVLHLTWLQVDFERQELRILKQGGFNVKERREKLIPMNEALNIYLQEWREAEPEATILFGKASDSTQLMWRDSTGVTTAISRHLKAVGLYGIAKPIHSFRARFATMLINKGRDISTVQALLGHQNIQTTLGYIAGVEPAKRKAIEGVSMPV